MIPKSISLVLALFTPTVLAVSSGGVLQTAFAQLSDDELVALIDILGSDVFVQSDDVPEVIFSFQARDGSDDDPPPLPVNENTDDALNIESLNIDAREYAANVNVDRDVR